jgi:hypothetical protein
MIFVGAGFLYNFTLETIEKPIHHETIIANDSSDSFAVLL